jgi:Thylakoid formation protein
VSETKRKFRESYPKPISGIYDAVVQELLVQQHLIRYNRKYKYNPVRGCMLFAPGRADRRHASLNACFLYPA